MPAASPLDLGRIASLHPMPGGRTLVATDLPLHALRLPVGTGSRVAFARTGLEDVEATVRAVGTPKPGATDPVLVFGVDAAVAARIAVGDSVQLVA